MWPICYLLRRISVCVFICMSLKWMTLKNSMRYICNLWLSSICCLDIKRLYHVRIIIEDVIWYLGFQNNIVQESGCCLRSKIDFELRTGEARWWVHMDSCRLALLLYIWLRFSLRKKKSVEREGRSKERGRLLVREEVFSPVKNCVHDPWI